MRFEGQTAVNIKITVFWDVVPFNVMMVTSILEESTAFMFHTEDGAVGFSEMLVTFYQTNIVQCPRRLQSEIITGSCLSVL
jgi:hypothetical protein